MYCWKLSMKLSDIINEVKNISDTSLSTLAECVSNSSKVVILGNGGSTAIASHIAVDYRKFLNKRVDVLTDASMLTMMANDYGQENSYAKFIEMNYEPNMLVILISSSGNSENIIRAFHKCVDLKCGIVSLSGFSKHNKLKTLSETTDTATVFVNYHVNSNSYGTVENMHQIFLHAIVDN